MSKQANKSVFAGSPLSAAEWNRLKSEVDRVAHITVSPPLELTENATGIQLRFVDDEFYASITGVDEFNASSSSSAAYSGNYAYSWEEVQPQGDGTFLIVPQGRTGTGNNNPAYEINNTLVEEGTIVLLRSGADTEFLFDQCCGGDNPPSGSSTSGSSQSRSGSASGSSASGSASGSGSSSASSSGSGSGGCGGFSGMLSRWRYQCTGGILRAYKTVETYLCGALSTVGSEAYDHDEGCCECEQGSSSASGSGSSSASSSGSGSASGSSASGSGSSSASSSGSGSASRSSASGSASGSASQGSGSTTGGCGALVSCVSFLTALDCEPTFASLVWEPANWLLGQACGSGNPTTCIQFVQDAYCSASGSGASGGSAASGTTLTVVTKFLVWQEDGFLVCDSCPGSSGSGSNNCTQTECVEIVTSAECSPLVLTKQLLVWQPNGFQICESCPEGSGSGSEGSGSGSQGCAGVTTCDQCPCAPLNYSVTVSGATGDMSIFNGTWSLTYTGTSGCLWTIQNIDGHGSSITLSSSGSEWDMLFDNNNVGDSALYKLLSGWNCAGSNTMTLTEPPSGGTMPSSLIVTSS